MTDRAPNLVVDRRQRAIVHELDKKKRYPSTEYLEIARCVDSENNGKENFVAPRHFEG